MLKRFVVVIFLCLTAYCGQAQTTFNERNALHSFNSLLTSVRELSGKYYCTGICIDSINDLQNGTFTVRQGVKFAVFNATGQKIRDTVWQRPDRQYTVSNNLFGLSDGTFLLAADGNDTSQNLFTVLFDFDTMGRVQWYKEFPKPFYPSMSGNFLRLMDFKPTGSGEWLMLSTIKCNPASGYHHDFLLTKLDQNFNVIWNKQYGDPVNNDYSGKLLVLPDGYLIAGGVNNSNRVTINYTYQAKLLKVDTSGAQSWEWTSPISRKVNMVRDVIRTSDGGLAYCSQAAGYEVQANPSYSMVLWRRSMVQKLDLNRNVVWTDTFSNLPSSGEFNEPRCLMELSSGDLVCAGAVFGGYNASDSLYSSFGSFVKIASNGQMIWKRKYAYSQDTFNHYLYDMERTSDGGFVMCGQSVDELYPFDFPKQRGWIIKADSNGCIGNDPQCWPVSVPEPSKPIFSIFPNPASDWLEIESALVTGRVQLQIFSGNGSVVLNKEININGRISIPLEGIPQGFYLYALSGKHFTTVRGKFLKL